MLPLTVAQPWAVLCGAALIMVAIFAGFASGDLVMFQQVGLGLGAAGAPRRLTYGRLRCQPHPPPPSPGSDPDAGSLYHRRGRRRDVWKTRKISTVPPRTR